MSGRAWRWLGEEAALAIHDAQLAEHGGAGGPGERALVQAALARPRRLAAGGEPDAAELAAAYACGLARTEGFADGKRRTAYVAALAFSLDNGYRFTGGDVESAEAMRALSAGDMTEEELARWFRARLVAAGS